MRLSKARDSAVGKVTVYIDAKEMLDPCCFRKPETELHNFVTVGRERAGKIFGIALTRLLCRPLCHDDGWVKIRKRTDDAHRLSAGGN